MKILNKKGSILQIVLVLFLSLISVLAIAISVFSFQTQSLDSIQIMMKQKNLEILLIRYYINEIENGFLMSDEIEEDSYRVVYTVDEMGNYAYIETYVSIQDVEYSFSLDLYYDGLSIKNFEYKGGL